MIITYIYIILPKYSYYFNLLKSSKIHSSNFVDFVLPYPKNLYNATNYGRSLLWPKPNHISMQGAVLLCRTMVERVTVFMPW